MCLRWLRSMVMLRGRLMMVNLMLELPRAVWSTLMAEGTVLVA